MTSDPSESLFEFWSEAAGEARVHPADAPVFARLAGRSTSEASVATPVEPLILPNPYFGALKRAPVVLLFLSPGLRDNDIELAVTKDNQSFAAAQRTGECALPSEEEYPATWTWWTARVRQFGLDPLAVRDKVAFLNIGAYRSKSFTDWHTLSALPSSRAALDWAQGVLFPQAERGERIVVCMRSAKHWGLGRSEAGPIGKSLFVPPVTQSGYILHGDFRDRVGQAIRDLLDLKPATRR